METLIPLQNSQAQELRVDTIVARATALGPGALGVVRLSGGEAFEILQRLTPAAVKDIPSRTASLVLLQNPGNQRLLDQTLVTVYRKPNSYTGEDVIEISCHGGSLVPELVLGACLESGARKAEPGEFTRRAVLNGKMDLIQAEAVLGLVEATSRASHEASLYQLERGLSTLVEEIRGELVELQASLASCIDFPEEDEGPATMADILENASRVESRLTALIANAPEGELLREGALVVLAGPPNSGKSSLYNKLLGRERAIVSEVPGTTRDAIEASISLDGFPFRLVDTAGIRSSLDTIERLGIEVAKERLGRADLVIFCLEAGAPISDEVKDFLVELKATSLVFLRTKKDLRPATSEKLIPEGLEITPLAIIEVSTIDNTGILELRKLLPGLVYGGLVKSGVSVPLLLWERQIKAVESARVHIKKFIMETNSEVPIELACVQLQSAETYLEELTGAVALEEVLDRLFASFCIGK